MKIKACFSLVAFLAAGLSSTAYSKEIKNYSMSGFVDSSYLYDRSAGSSSFSLDQAEIDITKEIKDWASLRTDIQYVNTGAELTADDILEQGFLTIKCPKGSGLELTFGKFNAPIGFELLDPVDMYQFSHALVFDNGLPTNLTGLMLSSSFAEMIDLNAYVVNGWDNINDNNKDKTVGGRIGITPTEGINFGISAISGPEQDSENTNRRSVLDIDATITVVPDLTIGMEFNWGWEDNASALKAGDDAKWFGLLLMTHYNYAKWGGFTFRYDYFDDKDGSRISPGAFEHQAITFSPTFVIDDGFGALIEYRHDFSNNDGYTDDNDTVAFEMTYSF